MFYHPDKPVMDVSQSLKILRDSGASVTVIAELTGISRVHLSRLINGHINKVVPRTKVLLSAAAYAILAVCQAGLVPEGKRPSSAKWRKAIRTLTKCAASPAVQAGEDVKTATPSPTIPTQNDHERAVAD